MKKRYLFLIILVVFFLIILNLKSLFIMFSPETCSKDCNNLCDLSKKCCYHNACVSGGCTKKTPDVGYYLKKYGFESSTSLIEQNKTDFLNWASCAEPLPK